MLVDVRTVPRSRTNPQFNKEMLEKSLPKVGVSYTHNAKLGGLRHAKKDSINQGWHNASFRGYADYMQTDDFLQGLEELLAFTKKHTVVIMCAETLPWRCHRSMVGDALLVRGYEVLDIFDSKNTKPEKLTGFAKVDGTTITYPTDTPKQNQL